MKTCRFNEGQIIKAIKELEGGRKAEDIVRDLGTAMGPFTNGSRNAARLKRLLADIILYKEILNDVIEKKVEGRRLAGTRRDDPYGLPH